MHITGCRYHTSTTCPPRSAPEPSGRVASPCSSSMWMWTNHHHVHRAPEERVPTYYSVRRPVPISVVPSCSQQRRVLFSSLSRLHKIRGGGGSPTGATLTHVHVRVRHAPTRPRSRLCAKAVPARRAAASTTAASASAQLHSGCTTSTSLGRSAFPPRSATSKMVGALSQEKWSSRSVASAAASSRDAKFKKWDGRCSWW